MSKRTKKRWGYPFLVTCSLVMGLSLWLHYSVSDAADSYDVVVKKLLEAGRKAQLKSKSANGKYLEHAPEMADSLRSVHRGPYLFFLNPGCEASLDSALVAGPVDVPGYPRLAEFLEVSKAHFKDLDSKLTALKTCPKSHAGYQFVAAAYERKKSQWDIWSADVDGKPKHLVVAKLPATRAHRIKQIAIVLLVLGTVGMVSLLIPGFLDRFYIRRDDSREDTNAPGTDSDKD